MNIGEIIVYSGSNISIFVITFKLNKLSPTLFKRGFFKI